jgi:hypothetical protein
MVTITVTSSAEAQAMTELMHASPPGIRWEVWLLGRKIDGREVPAP